MSINFTPKNIKELRALYEKKVRNASPTNYQRAWDHMLDALNEIKRLRDENAKLREQNRWIPIDERLPETQGRYQVYVVEHKGKPGKVDILWFFLERAGEWWRGCGVTHWKPLDEPPKEPNGN